MANEINGTRIGLYVGAELIAVATSHELSLSANMVETTSKDSGGDSEFIPGLRNATVSVEGFYQEVAGASSYNQEDLFALHADRTKVTLKWGELSTQTGETQYSASAYISSLSFSASLEDAVTFSAEFQITGAVTKAAIV